MNKILIAVDDTKGSKHAFSMCGNVCACMRPETIVLVYVEKLEGRSLMTDVLMSVSEMETLKKAIEGTEYQEKLDKRAQTVLDYYKNALAEKGLANIKTVVKKGHPAEEILNTAKEEDVGMILIGSRGDRTTHLFMGSVSREVANSADRPVLIVK